MNIFISIFLFLIAVGIIADHIEQKKDKK